MIKLSDYRYVQFRNQILLSLIKAFPSLDFTTLGNLPKIFEKCVQLSFNSPNKIFLEYSLQADLEYVNEFDIYNIYRRLLSCNNIDNTADFWWKLGELYQALYHSKTSTIKIITITDEITVAFVWNSKTHKLIEFNDCQYNPDATIQSMMDKCLFAISNGASIRLKEIECEPTLVNDTDKTADLVVYKLTHSFIPYKLMYSVAQQNSQTVLLDSLDGKKFSDEGIDVRSCSYDDNISENIQLTKIKDLPVLQQIIQQIL